MNEGLIKNQTSFFSFSSLFLWKKNLTEKERKKEREGEKKEGMNSNSD